MFINIKDNIAILGSGRIGKIKERGLRNIKKLTFLTMIKLNLARP